MNIRDIANLAGVGVSTVSRVINNKPDVNEETREKVLEVIKKTKFVPNNNARNLKKNNTNSIGVLVKGVFNPFFTEMIDVISKEVSKSSYTMILQHHDYSKKSEIDNLISFIKDKKLQGLICLGGNFIDINDELFEKVKIPVVLTSVNTTYDRRHINFSTVGIENDKASYISTRYLISIGHKNIAIIIGDVNDYGISGLRMKGYIEALRDNNIVYNENYVAIGNYNSEGAYKATIELLKRSKEITAIFAISDVMAIGCAKAVSDMGLVIGKDISIIGFDGMDVSKFYIPSITTTVQPKEEMAKVSINLLMKLINKEESHKHILLNTYLVKRQSCNKPKNCKEEF